MTGAGAPRSRAREAVGLASGTGFVGLMAVLITAGFVGSLFLIAGANPIEGAWQYLVLPLSTQSGLLEVLVTAPPLLAIPLVLAGGALAGALWVLGPALLRIRLGIDEVVTTLLLNPVALLLV